MVLGARASRVALVVKIPPANAGDLRNLGRSLGWYSPLEEGTENTPVFLSGESYGQGSLAGCSP